MLNLDPIQKMLKQYSGMSVHGITDSGWFMDQRPYGPEILRLLSPVASPIEAVKLGIPYWHSQIPSRCRNLYINEPSKCFIGHKIYPTLSGESPLSARVSTPVYCTVPPYTAGYRPAEDSPIAIRSNPVLFFFFVVLQELELLLFCKY